eukprot:scaffold7999_cov220-Pinguiococcus_pyrenoidosus.AAC.1
MVRATLDLETLSRARAMQKVPWRARSWPKRSVGAGGDRDESGGGQRRKELLMRRPTSSLYPVPPASQGVEKLLFLPRESLFCCVSSPLAYVVAFRSAAQRMTNDEFRMTEGRRGEATQGVKREQTGGGWGRLRPAQERGRDFFQRPTQRAMLTCGGASSSSARCRRSRGTWTDLPRQLRENEHTGQLRP